MSPSAQSTRKGKRRPHPGVYRHRRDRSEVLLAVLIAVSVFVMTSTVIWFTRPNRTSSNVVDPLSTFPQDDSLTSTTLPTDTTLPSTASTP